jgi:tRNA A-37 threonylcarbamoyl transferase component Bud32
MELVGDIARKKGKPSLLAVEALKSQRAGEIGRSSGLFYVPKVIDFDEKTGVLEFERLKGLVTLLDLAIKKDQRLFGLLEKAGNALAAIHQQLVLPDEMKHELPPEWMGPPEENVFIHGDFATINVCFHEPSGRLVILDWSAAPIMGRTPTFGSRFFDILWFACCIFRGVPAKRLLSWNAETMTDTFIKGYANASSQDRLSRFRDYLSKVYRLQRQKIRYLARRRSPGKAGLYISYQLFMYARLHRFLQNYKL